MSGKKIAFGSKPQSNHVPLSPDEWVNDRQAVEQTKRLTIDVSLSLHKRIKSRCATENQKMADVIRELLEQQFPPSGGAPS